MQSQKKSVLSTENAILIVNIDQNHYFHTITSKRDDREVIVSEDFQEIKCTHCCPADMHIIHTETNVSKKKKQHLQLGRIKGLLCHCDFRHE